jgi:N-acyl-D-amino-acid deacylase
MKYIIKIILFLILFSNCSNPETYDVLVRNGTIYDGSGNKPFIADIGINSDTIAFIGKLENANAKVEIDAKGLSVAPGFINVLSWAMKSLIEDGKSQSDIRQGVTLEVFGEGISMGPWTDKMKMEVKEHQGDIKFDIEWTSLDEYLEYMVKKGVSTNVASFVGATTLRIHTVGYEDRPPTKTELDSMRLLVRQAMEDGALGIGSSLIYAPAFYSSTEELIEICKEAAKYDGLYISHIRSEANKLLESIDELIQISKKSGIRAEIYHLKAAGKSNWFKLDSVIQKIEKTRAEGLQITANMYNYTAAATALDATMPPWVQEGGYKNWVKRLKNPEIRQKVVHEMKSSTDEWENFYFAAGSPENIILVGFKNDSLKHYTGKTLAVVNI